MPIDASIPLGVQAPQIGQMNPMAMISQWAQIQNAMNQNRLFQQTFLARQKAGQILANAPSLEEGLQGLLSDPDVAPFAGETINNIRQSQLTMSQLQEVQQGQVQSGLDAFVKMLPTVLASPDEATWNGIGDSVLARLPENLRPRAMIAMDSLKKAILDGLPSDPELAKQIATQRLSGLAIAGGLTPDGFKQLYGGTETLDLGDRLQPVRKLPEQLGGGYRSFDQTFPKGIAPQITTQSGVPFQTGGVPGANPLVPQAAPTSAPAAHNPLVPSAPGAYPMGNELAPDLPVVPESRPHYLEHPKIEQAPLAPPAGAQDSPLNAPNGARSRATPPAYASDLGLPGGSQRPGAAPPAPTATPNEPLTYTGKPLYAGIRQIPTQRSNLTGAPIRNPQVAAGIDEQTKRFYDEELKRYESQVSLVGALDRIDHDVETLAKGPASLRPGALGSQRLQVAKAINTAAEAIGIKELPFDPKVIAAGEDFTKEQIRAGLNLITENLGAQREAAQVIFGLMNAVPGMDNTVMGNMLISRILRASAHREIDKRGFQEKWVETNDGDMTGSLRAFNQNNPSKDYYQTVLKSMGMTEDGFESPIAIQRAKEAGYLTGDEAAQFLLDQFPDQFKLRRR